MMKKNAGIGLLELMLSISIIAVIIALAGNYFITTQRANNVSRTIDQITHLQTAIGNWKGKQTNYAGLTAKGLYDIGALTNNEYDPNLNKLYSPFGKNISIGPAGNNQAFYIIIFNDVPKWACHSIAEKLDQGANAYPRVICTADTTLGIVNN